MSDAIPSRPPYTPTEWFASGTRVRHANTGRLGTVDPEAVSALLASECPDMVPVAWDNDDPSMTHPRVLVRVMSDGRPSRDFFGGPPPVDPTDVPTEAAAVAEVLDVVPGAAVRRPGFVSSARPSSSTAGVAALARGRSVKNARDAMALGLESLGLPPGAAHYAARELSDDVEAASARARAFEVIARAAIEYIDAGVTDDDAERALADAVAENRAAVQ